MNPARCRLPYYDPSDAAPTLVEARTQRSEGPEGWSTERLRRELAAREDPSDRPAQAAHSVAVRHKRAENLAWSQLSERTKDYYRAMAHAAVLEHVKGT